MNFNKKRLSKVSHRTAANINIKTTVKPLFADTHLSRAPHTGTGSDLNQIQTLAFEDGGIGSH